MLEHNGFCVQAIREPIKILYRRFKNHPKILFVSFPSQIYFARIHVYSSYSAFDLQKHII